MLHLSSCRMFLTTLGFSMCNVREIHFNLRVAKNYTTQCDD